MTLDGPGSNTGALRGSGRLTLLQPTAFTNAGSVEPGGDGPGALTVSGDLSIPAGASLAIGIGGTESGTRHNRLNVEGAVTLGGGLAVSLLDGFEPERGQSFEVLTYTSREGTFDDLTGLDLGGGLSLEPNYSATGLVLTVVGEFNATPVASGDAAATSEGTAVLIDVLANDDDADGDALTLTSVGAPASGSAVIEGDQIRYTPEAGFVGEDAFTYTVSDGNGRHGRGDGETLTILPSRGCPRAPIPQRGRRGALRSVRRWGPGPE